MLYDIFVQSIHTKWDSMLKEHIHLISKQIGSETTAKMFRAHTNIANWQYLSVSFPSKIYHGYQRENTP